MLAAQPTTLAGLFAECYGVADELASATPPDAILAVTLGCAAIALRAVTEHGLSVPDDVLIAEDGNDSTLLATAPSITAIDHHPEALADVAVGQLAALLDSATNDEARVTLLTTDPIERESTRRTR